MIFFLLLSGTHGRQLLLHLNSSYSGFILADNKNKLIIHDVMKQHENICKDIIKQ